MSLFPTTRAPQAPAHEDAAPVDPVAARLQARVEALEEQPLDAAPRRPIQATRPTGGVALNEIEDLNQQLDLLREQLELAFDDVEARIAAADERAAAAVARAEAADTRAQVASARAANVLYAVDDLAAELARAAARGESDEVARLRGAVDRLRSRLQSD
jgi:hypothetical protein